MKIKKLLAIAGIATVMTLSSCSKEPEEVPVLKDFFNTDYASVVAMIDAIEVADLTTEKAIEDAFIAYSELEDSVKSEVTNIDKLQEYRSEVTKLYDVKDRRGDRIDHSKFLIGTYCVNPYIWTDEHFKAIKDCGIDVITGGAYNQTLLDLCAKNDLGVFLSYLPGWYGGDGSNSGQLINSIPSGAYNSYAENFVDNPVIWAMDVGDEPSSEDFPHYGVLINEAKELFPDKQIYLNLYPNYANKDQMGCKTYYEYIEKYIENVDTDYICYDHYLYALDMENGGDPILSFANLGIVSSAARKTDRDFWIVLQVSSDIADKWISEQQLRYQAYSAMTFGAKVIHWACYTAGWYKLHVVDSEGNLTEQYEKLQTVNLEIKDLANVYMRYTCKDAGFISVKYQGVEPVNDEFKEEDDGVIEQSSLSDVKSSPGSSILMGTFEKNVGEGTAFMFTNVTDYLCEEEQDARILFKTVDSNVDVIAYAGDSVSRLTADNDGYYKVDVPNGMGIFVTVTPVS